MVKELFITPTPTQSHPPASVTTANGDVADKIPVPGKLTVAGEVSGDQTDSISPVEHDIVVAAGQSCPTCGRPMPMTGAQRQARHRAKERDG